MQSGLEPPARGVPIHSSTSRYCFPTRLTLSMPLATIQANACFRNRRGTQIRRSEHLRPRCAVLGGHAAFSAGETERHIVLCLSGVQRWPRETLPFFFPASQAAWDRSPLLMAMWTSPSSRPPSQWELWSPITAFLDSNSRDRSISSAYTTLSGRPAHPGALLWKVSHLILLEVEFWLIKVDVSIGGKELRLWSAITSVPWVHIARRGSEPDRLPRSNTYNQT